MDRSWVLPQALLGKHEVHPPSSTFALRLLFTSHVGYRRFTRDLGTAAHKLLPTIISKNTLHYYQGLGRIFQGLDLEAWKYDIVATYLSTCSPLVVFESQLWPLHKPCAVEDEDDLRKSFQNKCYDFSKDADISFW
ncbi:hypothetical protein VTL71DRAFT_4239 [Oculimacula yallundae]|uniref:Uncharacterized protein n=1 Tax=Oculimacula yallundae TaxID=86028 RepID=A0ABR4C5A4_9HELO